jgi:hypothetical protein
MLNRAYIKILRLGERLCGPGLVCFLIFPLIVYRFVRNFSHYFQFRKLRGAMPRSFWKGVSPCRHFWRTFADWTGSLITTLFYDRLRTGAWERRFTVRGRPPWSLPEWGQHPFVIVFFHSGGFPVLKSWLRAQGVPAALYAGGIHAMHLQNEEYRERGDRAYGLENVPDMFAGPRSLGQAVRFLTPGRALLILLEQREFSKRRNAHRVGEVTICLDDFAFRMASMTHAMLLPAAVRQRGLCRFEIEFGEPVGCETTGQEGGSAAANLHLARELWRGIEEDPCAMTWTLMEALAPDLIGGRGQWP